MNIDSITNHDGNLPESQLHCLQYMFKDVISIFDELNIQWWPEKSNLLALVKYQKPLLDWNDHCDIGVLFDDFNNKVRNPNFISFIKSKGLEFEWFHADEILRINPPNPWMRDECGRIYSCHIDIYAFKLDISPEEDRLVLANKRMYDQYPNQYYVFDHFDDTDEEQWMKEYFQGGHNKVARKVFYNSKSLKFPYNSSYKETNVEINYLLRYYKEDSIESFKKIVYYRDPKNREAHRTQYMKDIDNNKTTFNGYSYQPSQPYDHLPLLESAK